MIFVTEEIFLGQLFDANIFRMKIKMKFSYLIFDILFEGIGQIATISLRDNPDDEQHIAGIK
jgi:hypothetical protein